MLRKSFQVSYLIIPYMFQGFLTIPSLIFIESGGYITEQDRAGYFVGATIIFFLFNVTSILINWFVLKYFINKLNIFSPIFIVNKKNIDLILIKSFIVLILILLLINLAISPIPFFNADIDRFVYWENSKLPFLGSVLGNTSSFLAFGIGCLFLRMRKQSIYLISIYILYLILIGHKYTSLINAIYLFFLPYVLINSKSKVNWNYLFKIPVLAISFALFGLVYYKYSINSPFENAIGDSTIMAIFYRIFGLQGHVWWGAMEQYAFSGTTSHSWNLGDLSYGMHHLMRLLAPHETIEIAIEKGVSFTNGYPAILLKIFPVSVAFIFNVIIFAIPCLIAGLFARFTINGSYIIAMIFCQFYMWTMYAFKMAYFYKLYPVIVGTVFVLLIIIFLSCLNRRYLAVYK